MASLKVAPGSVFFLHRQGACRCGISYCRMAASGFETATAAVVGRLAPCGAIGRVAGAAGVGVTGPQEVGSRGTGTGQSQRKGVVPGAAVARVAGSFSGRRRIKAAVPTRAAQSLYAEELARCETSSQVLQLVFSSPSDDSQQIQQEGRPSRENMTLPYLLPVDCLAFLNALLRVQQLRRSGSDFLFFCRVLEDTLQRYNARWLESFPTGVNKKSAEDDLKLASHEIRFLQEMQDSNVHGASDVSKRVRRASLGCRPPPHAGRFVRLVLQKLSDLKAPLAFTQMIPYLAPHVSSLAPFDVAECLWSFAVLQPPEWRSKHGPLLMQLLQRLLDVKSRLPSTEDRGATSCTQSAQRVKAPSASRGSEKASRARGESETTPTTEAAAAEGREKTMWSKDADRERLRKTVKQDKLEESLEWVSENLGEGNRQYKRKGEDTLETEVLLLDDLSNLMIYRVVFGIAKLDFRCRTAQEVYQALAPRIVRRLEQTEVEAFPPAYLVRMAWSYARMRVRHISFYRSVCKVLTEVLEDLSYKELKVVKHVYEALQIKDRKFLSALDLLLHQMQELNATEEGFAENTHRAPRVKPFKTRPKRAALTDPVR